MVRSPIRARNRILISATLGSLTTITVAWTLALVPRQGSATWSGFLVAPNGEQKKRQTYIVVHGGPRSAWFEVMAGVDSPGEIAPAWSPSGAAPSPAQAQWRMFPTDRAAIEAATHVFELPPRWPWWLPDMPRTTSGLVVYGGRAAGWPLISMRSISISETPFAQLQWRGSWRWRPYTNYAAPDDPELGSVPLIPVPAGFAADTALFATVLWIVFGGPRDVVRWRRLRNGLCPWCAYDQRGLLGAKCPECGRSS